MDITRFHIETLHPVVSDRKEILDALNDEIRADFDSTNFSKPAVADVVDARAKTNNGNQLRAVRVVFDLAHKQNADAMLQHAVNVLPESFVITEATIKVSDTHPITGESGKSVMQTLKVPQPHRPTHSPLRP